MTRRLTGVRILRRTTTSRDHIGQYLPNGQRSSAELTLLREYYILKKNPASSQTENTATYCGAYAHKDLNSNGDFVKCSS